jgi:hypothetical protein
MVMEHPLKGYLSMLYTWHVVGMGRGYLVVNEWMNEWKNEWIGWVIVEVKKVIE